MFSFALELLRTVPQNSVQSSVQWQADDKSLNVVALLPSLIPGGGAVSSRASNEGSRRFHNHGESPNLGLLQLQVESAY